MSDTSGMGSAGSHQTQLLVNQDGFWPFSRY